MSELLEQELIEQEGVVEGGLPYKDIGGTMTIGFGYTKYSLDGKDGRPHWSEYWDEEGNPTGKTMSRDEAKKLMPSITKIYRDQAMSVLSNEDVTEVEINALSNLIYRNGLGNVQESGVIDAFNSGDLDAAQNIIKNNINLRKSGGVVLQEGDVGYKGITNRNTSIADSLERVQPVEETTPTTDHLKRIYDYSVNPKRKWYPGTYEEFKKLF